MFPRKCCSSAFNPLGGGTPAHPSSLPPAPVNCLCYTPDFSLIQLRNFVTRVYIPGLSLRAQPSPQLTTPARNKRLLSPYADMGPPESPWNGAGRKCHYGLIHTFGGPLVCPGARSASHERQRRILVKSPTWQASTPPLSTPAHSMREVIWLLISWLHTVWLMIRTSAFCKVVALEPEGHTAA